MITELLKQGKFEWSITKEDGRIEINLNEHSSLSYPSERLDIREAELNLVGMILRDLQLNSYEIRKKERSKGILTFLGEDG